MKVRSGFVSNSSTSSFIAVGFKLPSDFELTMEKKLELLKKFNIDGVDDIVAKMLRSSNQTTSSMILCTKCDKIVTDLKYCPECGTKVIIPSTTEEDMEDEINDLFEDANGNEEFDGFSFKDGNGEDGFDYPVVVQELASFSDNGDTVELDLSLEKIIDITKDIKNALDLYEDPRFFAGTRCS
jgi:hypothetical protein